MQRIQSCIRAIEDFPIPGITFRDITPLLANPKLLRLTVHQLVFPFIDQDIDYVAGMEARGFIFGSLCAQELNAGFIPLRKPGKLPFTITSVPYSLEYADNTLEAHTDALNPGDRVLIVDDLIATGGTAAASCKLVESLGGNIIACVFVIELDELNGRDALAGHSIHSLIHY
jgi:adenine phosphoribosyltransferase